MNDKFPKIISIHFSLFQFPIQQLFRLLACLTACFFFTYASAQQPTPIGRTLFVQGQVQAISNAGINRSLTRQSPVYEGDTVETGPNGYVQLRMIDSAQITLRADTQLAFDEYTFTANSIGDDSALMRLFRGGFRTISGEIENERTEYITPYATIGVRGTTHEAFIDPLINALYTGVYDGGTVVSNIQGTLDLGLGASFDFSRTFAGEAPEGLLLLPAPLQQANPFIQTPNVDEQATVASAVDAVNAAVAAINNNDPQAEQAFVAATTETAEVATAFIIAAGIDSGDFIAETATAVAEELDTNSLRTVATLLSTDNSQALMSNLAENLNPQQNSAEIYQLRIDSLNDEQLALVGGFLNQGFADLAPLIDEHGAIDIEVALEDPANLETLLGLLDIALTLLPEDAADAALPVDPVTGLPALDPVTLVNALQSQLTNADIANLLFTRTGIEISPLEALPNHQLIVLNARSASGAIPAIAGINLTPPPEPLASWSYWDQETFFPGTEGFFASEFRKGFLVALLRAFDPAALAALTGEFSYSTDEQSLLAGTATGGDLTSVTMGFDLDFATGTVSGGKFIAEVNSGQEVWQLDFAGQLTGGVATFDQFTNNQVIRGTGNSPVSGSIRGVFTGTGITPDFISGFALQDLQNNGVSGLTLLRSAP